MSLAISSTRRFWFFHILIALGFFRDQTQWESAYMTMRFRSPMICHNQAGEPGSRWRNSDWVLKPKTWGVGWHGSSSPSWKTWEPGLRTRSTQVWWQEKMDAPTQTQRENLYILHCCFVLFGPLTSWRMPTHIKKGKLIHSVYWFFSQTPRNNVLLANWASLNPV
jgi:hypothetical protein